MNQSFEQVFSTGPAFAVKPVVQPQPESGNIDPVEGTFKPAAPSLETEEQEYFDIVDENDIPTGQIVTRQEAHDKGLIHRAVTVLVINTRGELFMIRRSPHKKRNPNKWQAAPSGHVQAGESYEQAALRELEEELGIPGEIQETTVQGEPFLRNYIEGDREHFKLFICQIGEEVAKRIRTNEEAAEYRFMGISEVRYWVKRIGYESGLPRKPHDFRDVFPIMFRSYFPEEHDEFACINDLPRETLVRHQREDLEEFQNLRRRLETNFVIQNKFFTGDIEVGEVIQIAGEDVVISQGIASDFYKEGMPYLEILVQEAIEMNIRKMWLLELIERRGNILYPKEKVTLQ